MNNIIKVRGARTGGLKEVDMDLPLGSVICFTGRSSSGRRAMALEVLFAESRRRYMQALAPAERGNSSGVAQVDVDEIAGLPPAIYLEPDRRGRTVGDYLQLDGVLAQIMVDNGEMHCSKCGGLCRGYEAREVEVETARHFSGKRCLVLAPLKLGAGSDWVGVGQELREAGFTRIWIGSEILRLDGDLTEISGVGSLVHVVVDRLVPTPESSVRFLEAVRVSRSISSGQTVVLEVESNSVLNLNQQPTCGQCGHQYQELAAVDLGENSSSDLARQVSLGGWKMSDLRECRLDELRVFFAKTSVAIPASAQIEAILAEICGVNLGGIALNRSLDSLGAGEWQRLQLVACLSSGLMGILYIFDGLGSQLDTGVLLKVIEGLKRLAERGNTVLLLDHTPDLVAGADQVWEFVDGSPSQIQFKPSSTPPVQKKRVKSAGDLVAIYGQGGVGCLDVEFPQGALTCIRGFSGSGKTRLLFEVLSPILKGKASNYEVVGLERNKRVVEVIAPGRESTLMEALGIFGRIAELYAESPAAVSLGWGRDAFLLDRPGGRCPSCEGEGRHYFDLEFLEDISLACSACEGRRYREEIREITLRGVSIAEVLEMSIVRASTHFIRDSKLHQRLDAAVGYGLGYLLLGQNLRDLERGEWLRLRLALESTRASRNHWILIDDPASGDHADDLRLTAAVLRGLVVGGATVVVADQEPRIVEEADWLVDMA